jgi:hypothetical protein
MKQFNIYGGIDLINNEELKSKTMEKKTKVTVELVFKNYNKKNYSINYISEECVYKYIYKSIFKSEKEKRKTNDYVIGGYYNGVFIGLKEIQKKYSFPKRIALNLKNITKAKFIKNIENKKNWVIMEVEYKYKNSIHKKRIRLNTKDLID